MQALWRLYRAQHGPGLDGAGGLFSEGRWHTRGERVVYFGASAAIVVLERLAHIDPDLLPSDLRLGYFEFSGDVSACDVAKLLVLPDDWVRHQALTRSAGKTWRLQGTSCLLKVPSAILPEETNFVLDPRHPDAQDLRLVKERAFQFDPRLVESGLKP
jgi:RES domain-containing protein